MGGIYRDSSGNERYVFDDQRTAAELAGFKPRDEQSFVDSQGDVTTMSPDQQTAAFGQRIAPELQGISAEQLNALTAERNLETAYGGFTGGLEAFGLGAARGATFGLSDLLFDPEALKKYQAAHGGLSLAGSIVGGIGVGAASGLTAGAAKLGAALAPGSKAAAALIAGGAEGMAFGAGQGVSSLIIKNEPLTAESVFSEMGTNIFLGGAFGAGGGLVGHGLTTAGGKLLGRSEGKLSRLADDLDPERALAANSDLPTAVPLNSAKGKILTQDFVSGLEGATGIADDLAVKARAGTAVDVPSETLVRHARLTRDWLEPTWTDLEQRAAAGQLTPDMEAFVRKNTKGMRRMYRDLIGADAELDALNRPELLRRGGNASVKALDDDARRALAKKLVNARESARTLHQKVGGSWMDEAIDEAVALDRYAKNTSSAKFAAREGVPTMITNKMRADLKAAGHSDEAIHSMTPEQAWSALGGGGESKLAEHAALYEAGKKELFDALMVRNGVPKKRQLEVFAEMSVEDAAKVAKAYSRMTQGAEAMSKAMGSDFGVQAAQLADELAKVKAAIGSIAKPAAGAPAGSAMETMLAFGLIDQAIPDIDGPADEILSLWLAAKVGRAGSAGAAISKAGGNSWLPSLLKSGARNSAYRAAGKAAGGGIVGGGVAAATSNAAGKLMDGILGNTAGLAKATGRGVARAEGVVGKMLQTAGKVTRKAAPFSPKAYLAGVKFADLDHDPKTPAFEQRAAEIRANVANSYGVQKTVMRNLGELAMTHPGIADKTIAHADRVMKFLGAKVPRDPGTVMRLGRSGWKASDQDIAKLARYTRAALDPDGELERFADMDLSPEGAEALRVLYPAKFAKFQEQIAANLPALQQKLSFPEQVQMSILFNVPVNSLMEPKTVRALQATHAADATATPVSQPPAGSSPNPLSPAQELLAR